MYDGARVEYDAIVVLSFGGPESPDDVIPFLENVLRGRNVPRERMLAVAEHYYHFGGRSPINDQNRALIRALEAELAAHGPKLPVYWGNRNWHPLLADTMAQMRDDGVRNALAFATSAWSSYSGCRQYREDIARAIEKVGEGAPRIEKIRHFHNHPGFLGVMAERCREALAQLTDPCLIFTAHSVPLALAETSRYVEQIEEACRLTAELAGHPSWRQVYQSRSGPSTQPWLEPDILDHLRELAADGVREVVVAPIGFISDHMEVLYDLDYEASHLASELGVKMVRAGTPGTHPRFISMIRELILERTAGAPARFLGDQGPSGMLCQPDCCALPSRPGSLSRL